MRNKFDIYVFIHEFNQIQYIFSFYLYEICLKEIEKFLSRA